MSSCDKEGMMISKSLEFPMKSEIEDPLSPSAVNPENSGLFCDVGLLNEESLIIDPDLEIKTEPEIIESSEGDMKCSYDYDVSVSEDNLQSCKNEVNEEEENVKTYSRTGVKEEYGIEFETFEKEDEGKGSENSGCEKSLCQARDSKTHHKTHREEKSYKCMECGKEYNYKYLLIIHYRDHTGEKPFKCDACGKRYNHKSLLMIHYRIHTGEKPFKCNICGKAFIQKNHLTAHHRSHNGEKAFKCNVCDTTFTEKSNLTRHYRIHTKPFKFNSCDKAFTEKSGLTAHQRIHTGRQ